MFQHSLEPLPLLHFNFFFRSFKNQLQNWSISWLLSPSGLLVLLQSSSSQQKQWKVSWAACSQHSVLFIPEIMICRFCSSKQNQKLTKTLLVCSRCLGNSYFHSFNSSADVQLFAVLVNVFDPLPLHMIGHKSSVNHVAFGDGTIKQSTEEAQQQKTKYNITALELMAEL